MLFTKNYGVKTTFTTQKSAGNSNFESKIHFESDSNSDESKTPDSNSNRTRKSGLVPALLRSNNKTYNQNYLLL